MGGEEVLLLFILNLGTRWGWVVSVTPRPRFTPGERTPGTHWIGGWVGLRAGLDAGARRKICPYRGSNLDRPIVQPVAKRGNSLENSGELFSCGHGNLQKSVKPRGNLVFFSSSAIPSLFDVHVLPVGHPAVWLDADNITTHNITKATFLRLVLFVVCVANWQHKTATGSSSVLRCCHIRKAENYYSARV
jgi:hypothetical protein